MKIYTKNGDKGETGLLGGLRVGKDDLAVELCGELDESNCSIGVALAHGLSPANEAELIRIQQDLFVIGSAAAGVRGESSRAIRIALGRVGEMEQRIDEMEAKLPAMDAFILPGGVPVSAALHLARSVVRRAERCLVALIQQLPDAELFAPELMYLNRLSDLLFVMARFENFRLGGQDTKWLPKQANK